MSKNKSKIIPVFRNAGRVLTDEEVLRAKRLLRVDETATILRVSPRQVRNLVEAGQLNKHPEKPLRITTNSVSKYLGGD